MTSKDHVKPNFERPIMLLVLGPHRSGTSLAARMLECLGAVNSTNLNPANEHNPKGYFEDWDVYQFNDKALLPALGAAWGGISPVDLSVLGPEEWAGLRAQAVEIIQRNYPTDAPLCILKEPRLCRLLPFWLPVLDRAGFDVRVVLVVRDPISMARSLARRDGFSLTHGALLYLSCWDDILRDTSRQPAAFVRFEEILHTPSAALREVALTLTLPLPGDFADRLEEFSTRHLDLGLCHNRASSADTTPDTGIPEPVVRFFDALLAAAKHQDVSAARAAADSSAKTPDLLAPLMRAFDDRLTAQTAAPRQEPDQAMAHAARLSGQLVKARAAQSELTADHAKECARLQKLLARREALLADLNNSTSWRWSAPMRWLRIIADLVTRPGRLAASWHILRHHRTSGLFDAEWYRRQNPHVSDAAARPFVYFALRGVHAGHAPNPYFDAGYYASIRGRRIPTGRSPLVDYVRTGFHENQPCCPLFDQDFYLQANPDIDPRRLHVLTHYVRHGWREGRNPHPLFDVRFFEETSPARENEPREPLARYLHGGWQRGADPHPFFEVRYYLRKNPAVEAAGLEPLFHFHHTGAFQRRDPIEDFNCALMLGRHPHLAAAKINPLFYYLHYAWESDPFPEFTLALSLEGVLPGQSAARAALRRRFLPARATAAYPDRPLATTPPRPGLRPQTDIRAIAIYLPQFHAIPENDTWWGRGFTEWTNVRRGVPQYEGHYQPHIPHRDLGYYDLNDPMVMERQAEMARAAGIEGFCFYYYWFDGKRLLEMPLDRLLATGQPDFPFCLCWANENWSRRWDGREHEILLAQHHSPESDERFIQDVLPALRDRRYIRIDGRPLLVVYRPNNLPDAAATSRLWREVCRAEGLGEIFLACMQGIDSPDPAAIGFDAAIQFPPLRAEAARIEQHLALHKPQTFTGCAFDYRHMVVSYAFAARKRDAWPAVCPSWDNTARTQERGHSWINATPQNFRLWLTRVVADLRADAPEGRRVLFINAWNEWAEGNHLEPDQRHGYAWLNATRQALSPAGHDGLRILVVGHDSFPAGAQTVLLCFLRELHRTGGAEARVLLGDAGSLLACFQQVAPTSVLGSLSPPDERAEKMKAALDWEPDVILSNTVVNGLLLEELAELAQFRIPVVTHVHEMQQAIESWAPGRIMELTLKHTSHFIAVSAPVKDNLRNTHKVPGERMTLIHEFLDVRRLGHPDTGFIRTKRGEIGITGHGLVVLGCGTADSRKGVDLFVAAARQVRRMDPAATFVWIGSSPTVDQALEVDLTRAREDGDVCFLGERADARECIAAADIFFLSSREDPYPLVALEAADAAVPVVAFEGSGGIPAFLGRDAGVVVPAMDVAAAAQAIMALGVDPLQRRALGHRAREKLQDSHGAPAAVAKILHLLRQAAGAGSQETVASAPPRVSLCAGRPLVSVIVPNYNHAPFLGERLESIVRQGVDDIEIILLDDASTDASPEILASFCRRDRRARFLPNTTNSGSPFRQWRRGLLEARGEFVWIAESDDSASPGLLLSLLRMHEDNPGLSLCYSQSLVIDLGGRPYGQAWTHTADIGPERWKNDYVSSGLDELRHALSIKNTIPNASAVVFRNTPHLAGLVDDSLRLCADWLLYVRLCEFGGIGYRHQPLNLWRLGSSGARTRPAGETEWQESPVIFSESARILGWSDAELHRRSEAFKQRCDRWRNPS
jgi:glycosyltransferase involved in cell wall biosynthesis